MTVRPDAGRPDAGRPAEVEQVGERTFVIRTGPYLLNSILVVGDDRALLVDTGGGPAQAATILAAVRSRTDRPLVVVNTHAHLDHWFGNATVRACGAGPFLAHPAAIEAMGATFVEQQVAWTPTFDDAAAAVCDAADLPVATGHELDLGGLRALVRHLGRGHTGGDLVVLADRILLAGDLVEEGADPAFEDAYPREWVATLDALLRLVEAAGVDHVVGGHGAVVGPQHVRAERDRLAGALEALAGDPGADLPYGADQAAHLRRRALGPTP